jgi:hypothetical protein
MLLTGIGMLISSTTFALSSIPNDGRLTGQWPSAAPDTFEGVTPFEKTNMLLVGDPKVTMVESWKAQIDFTTAVPTPAVIVYYGQYDEAVALLPLPRFREFGTENFDGNRTEHSVTLDLSKLKKTSRDINGMAEKNGGVVAYRIEIFNSGNRLFDFPAVRLYDQRFEFYNGQLVPTVIEGPFVDQITETSAIISWDTDQPVDGTVKVEGEGNFEATTKNATHFEVSLTGLKPGTTHPYLIQITDGSHTTETRQFFFSTPAENTTQFTFAVLGDSREGYGGGEYQYNGTNAQVMGALATNIFNQNAEFILHTGDMVNGYTDSAIDFEMQLESYKDSVENVGHYLPIYEMIGNHEVVVTAYNTGEDDKSHLAYGFLMADKEGDESGEVIFAQEFVNPANGPEPDNVSANVPEGKSLPPYLESVYHFDYGNSRFVVMNNNYWYNSYPEKFGGNLEGFVLDDQTKWLIDIFNQTKEDDAIEHVFLFAQEPMFPNGGQSTNAMWYNGGDADLNGGWDRTHVVERRDEIWKAFVDTGKAGAANFGDEHNYSRTLITKDRNGEDFAYPVWQMISGGAGAPYSADYKDDLPWSANVVKTSTQYGYTLFHVDGSRIKYESYNIHGHLLDSAELTMGSSLLTSSSPTVNEGATVSEATGRDNAGEPLESEAIFESSIISANAEKMTSEEIETQFTIIPASEDVGKKVELVLVVKFDDNYYMLDENEWVTWNFDDWSGLQAFEGLDELPEVLDVSFTFALAVGEYKFYIGYRLENGSIIYNEEPLRFVEN